MTDANDEYVLREVLIREIETINEYQQMLSRARDADVRRFLAHAIQEEKEHVAEAMQLLRSLDPMQDHALSEDHSAHFRPGGPGDRALAALTGGAAETAREGSPRAESKAPPVTKPAASLAPPTVTRTAEHSGLIGLFAPNADLGAATVGNLKVRE